MIYLLGTVARKLILTGYNQDKYVLIAKQKMLLYWTFCMWLWNTAVE